MLKLLTVKSFGFISNKVFDFFIISKKILKREIENRINKLTNDFRNRAAQPNMSGSQFESIRLYYSKFESVTEFGKSIKSYFEFERTKQ